jgi:hypothetical protein
MKSNKSQGLGGSLLLYLAALLGGLMLFALPVFFISGGTTLENPGLAAYVPPPGALLIRKPDPNAMQLSLLKHDNLIDAGQLAAISAKTKKADRPRRTFVHSEPRERYAAQPQPRGFFFGLF